jgi:acyl carrier protein
MQKPAAVPNGASKTVPASDTFTIVQHSIAEVSGWDPEEITLDSRFDEEDLGLSMSDEFPMMVARIRKKLSDLGETITLPLEDVRNCEVVAELIELIDDEREL